MRWPLALLALAVCASTGCGTSTTDAATRVPSRPGPLRWAPPALTDPIEITLADGYTETSLDPARDYVVRLPQHVKRGGITLAGGHDVVLVGGHVTVPAGAPPGRENDKLRRGLYIKGATGTVHVEGVLFDADPGIEWDAIDINAPAAAVQLEDIRVDGVRGSFGGFHGDVVQPWGGVRSLRIDRLSASSNYQGLMIPIDKGPIGAAHVSHVDLHGLASSAPGTAHLLWLTSGSRTCDSYPVGLGNVWVQPPAGVLVRRSVWPQPRRPGECGARTRRGHVSWPLLPSVHGYVHAGVPPGGSYVPRGRAGIGYATPGYRGAR
jgi:hypothetical protein